MARESVGNVCAHLQ